MAKSRALQAGILGAIVGGLKFKLDEEAEQRRAAAEEAKMMRLEQIQIEREQRAEGRAIAGEDRAQSRDLVNDERDHIQSRELENIRAGNESQQIDQRADASIRVQGASAAIGHRYNVEDREDRQAEAYGMFRAEDAATRQRDREQYEMNARQSNLLIMGGDGKLYEPGTVPESVEIIGTQVRNPNGGLTFQAVRAGSKAATPARGAAPSHRGQQPTALNPAGYEVLPGYEPDE